MSQSLQPASNHSISLLAICGWTWPLAIQSRSKSAKSGSLKK
jgi:hypothetical protein